MRKFTLVLFSFLLTLAAQAQTTVFYESFDQCTGKGGNDGSWSPMTSTDPTCDNDGWAFTYGYGADKCVRVGNSTKAGVATTPALGITGKATMTFKLAGYKGNSANSKVKLSISGGGSLSRSSITLSDQKWTTYTVTITGGTADTKVTLTAANDRFNRYFLDSVTVVCEAAPTRTFTDNGSANDFSSAKDLDATVSRKVLAGSWNAIALPFAMNKAQIAKTFGADTKVAEFKGDSNGTISFESLADNYIMAGHPYLVRPSMTEDLTEFSVSGVTIPDGLAASTVEGTDYDFIATLEPVAPGVAGCFVFSTKDKDTYYELTPTGTVKAFRGYLKPQTASAKSVESLLIDGNATRVEGITVGEKPSETLYNLNGQRVDGAYKGIVVRQGRKYINK